MRSYTVTVKTPYKSSRKILLRGNAKLSALAESILDAYGIVRDRAYFFFTGEEPWEGSIYTDTEEFSEEFSACCVRVDRLVKENESFLFQIGYDPEFVFECKAEPSSVTASAQPSVIKTSGGTASEILPVEEEYGVFPEDVQPEEEEEYEEMGEIYYSPTELTVDRYIRAAVALYGVLPKAKMREIIRVYEPQISEGQMKEALRILPPVGYRGDYVIMGGEILYPELAEFQTGEYFSLKNAQRGKRYYLPQREEFLRYAQPAYFEKNARYLALESLLREITTTAEKTAEDLLRMMTGGLTADEALSVAKKIYGQSLDTPAVKNAVSELSHNIRRWENRGNY